MTHPIDRQLTIEGAKELKRLEESFSDVLDAFSWTSFGVQLAMAYGLKYFWKTINILQFAVFMQQWGLSWPNNSKTFLQLLKNLALMEFMPKDEIIDFVSDYF